MSPSRFPCPPMLSLSRRPRKKRPPTYNPQPATGHPPLSHLLSCLAPAPLRADRRQPYGRPRHHLAQWPNVRLCLLAHKTPPLLRPSAPLLVCSSAPFPPRPLRSPAPACPGP